MTREKFLIPLGKLVSDAFHSLTFAPTFVLLFSYFSWVRALGVRRFLFFRRNHNAAFNPPRRSRIKASSYAGISFVVAHCSVITLSIMSERLPSVSEIEEEGHGVSQSQDRNPLVSFGARLRNQSSNVSTPSSDNSSGSRGYHRHLHNPFRRGEWRREDSGELSSRTFSSAMATRLGRKSFNSDIESSAGNKSTEPSRVYRRYRVGDPVLVSNHTDSSRVVNLVNRYGFPPGEGLVPEEQRGPYRYILATVAKVHFGENAQYYTVTRADTGNNQRADDEWMEPLLSARGEAAARRAATQYADADSDDRNHENDSKLSRDPLYILVMPFVVLGRCIYQKVLKKIYLCLQKCVRFMQGQARLFLNGMPPYSCSVQFTMVNFLVVCSVWFNFLDSVRLAFCKPSADFSLAIVDL